ncbi:MAG: hypothetical protein KBH07_09980 [Flavobacteriales bacterium]|nr:hypothetical protein [Flavobacteriales bacterium]MBP9081128.1 hypothetical protein [Flavobacteriales bacterium]
MNRARHAYWWMVAGPLVLLAVVLWQAWPYLAISQPSGSKVLVVEGWMEEHALEEAARLILDSGYVHVYTTGTVRPFAYYLPGGRGLSVELHEPAQGNLEVDASGLPGTGFLLIADGDTLLRQAVEPRPQVFRTTLPRAMSRLHVVAWPMQPPVETPAIFIGGITIGGLNLNLLQDRTWFTRPDDAAEPAWPTYAQSARGMLIRFGVPAGLVTAVPAYGRPRSRTWGNAHAFGIQARNDGITAFDVATVGVHARRSRNLFRTAVGPGSRVGVVALTDPGCTRANWWRSYPGWITLLKEVIGTPETQAVEIKRWVAPPQG